LRILLLTPLVVTALSAGASLQAQTESGQVDSTISQEERICKIEVQEVEEMRAGAEGELDPMQVAKLERLMAEAREFCERGNSVMAAIRLEAAQAMIEVARPPAQPGGDMIEEESVDN
jgi:hypothetical protein